MEHYFQKYNKGGASHPKETEKWTVSFERFLSLHKLTLSWHKERIKKRNENKKAFFITVINISIVKPEQFCARKEKKKQEEWHLMQYKWVFILSLLWFSLSFTFYFLDKHEKQCHKNFAVVIFIYGGSMTANAECCHKFRGLVKA